MYQGHGFTRGSLTNNNLSSYPYNHSDHLPIHLYFRIRWINRTTKCKSIDLKPLFECFFSTVFLIAPRGKQTPLANNLFKKCKYGVGRKFPINNLIAFQGEFAFYQQPLCVWYLSILVEYSNKAISTEPFILQGSLEKKETFATQVFINPTTGRSCNSHSEELAKELPHREEKKDNDLGPFHFQSSLQPSSNQSTVIIITTLPQPACYPTQTNHNQHARATVCSFIRSWWIIFWTVAPRQVDFSFRAQLTPRPSHSPSPLRHMPWFHRDNILPWWAWGRAISYKHNQLPRTSFSTRRIKPRIYSPSHQLHISIRPASQLYSKTTSVQTERNTQHRVRNIQSI